MPQKQVQNSVPQFPVDKKADEIKAQVDEIFELAKSNMWDFEQFANKILAGTVACNPGYVAIALGLITIVIGLQGEANDAFLLYLVAQTNKLDMATINKAQQLFHQGLLIKCLKYEQGTL